MSAVHAVSRSVRDSAALLDATAGPDLGAPYAAQAPTRPFLDEVSRAPDRLRIAIQTQAWNGIEPHADCLAALGDAVALCKDLGHDVEEAPFIVDPTVLAPATLTILSASTRAMMEQRAEVLGRPLRKDDVEPGTWALANLSQKFGSTDYVKAVQTIHATGRALARHLQSHDVVLSPTMATPPHPLGLLSLSNPDRTAQAAAILQTVGYTQLANATGHPAMSVPLFWSDAGLPIGIQFMGRMNEEGLLFQLAGQIEAARPWFERRPDLD
jgi:Asp-tRNA(Asn)/Glu-tRNA(Gln) amidotransferase A subunit family amidase